MPPKGGARDSLLLKVMYPAERIGSVRVAKDQTVARLLRDVAQRFPGVFSKEDSRLLLALRSGGRILQPDEKLDNLFSPTNSEVYLVKGVNADTVASLPSCPTHQEPLLYFHRKKKASACYTCMQTGGVSANGFVTLGDLTHDEVSKALNFKEGGADAAAEGVKAELSVLIDRLVSGADYSPPVPETQPASSAKTAAVAAAAAAAQALAAHKTKAAAATEKPRTSAPAAAAAAAAAAKEGAAAAPAAAQQQQQQQQGSCCPAAAAQAAVTPEGVWTDNTYSFETELLRGIAERGGDARKKWLQDMPTHVPTKDGVTPLYGALVLERWCCGDMDVPRALLKSGVDVNGVSRVGRESTDSCRPLHFACARRDPTIVKLLLGEGRAKTAVSSSWGTTPLLEAMAPSRKIVSRSYQEQMVAPFEVTAEMISALTCHGSSINEQSPDGYTPLMHAVKEEKEMFDHIMTRYGHGPAHEHFDPVRDRVDALCLDLNTLVRVRDGATPLMIAAEANRSRFIEELFAEGADPCLYDRFGASILVKAAGRREAYDALLKLPSVQSRLDELTFRRSRIAVFHQSPAGATRCEPHLRGLFTGTDHRTPDEDRRLLPPCARVTYDALLAAVSAGFLPHVERLLGSHAAYWKEKESGGGGGGGDAHYPYASLREAYEVAFLTAVGACRTERRSWPVARHLLSRMKAGTPGSAWTAEELRALRGESPSARGAWSLTDVVIGDATTKLEVLWTRDDPHGLPAKSESCTHPKRQQKSLLELLTSEGLVDTRVFDGVLWAVGDGPQSADAAAADALAKGAAARAAGGGGGQKEDKDKGGGEGGNNRLFAVPSTFARAALGEGVFEELRTPAAEREAFFARLVAALERDGDPLAPAKDVDGSCVEDLNAGYAELSGVGVADPASSTLLAAALSFDIEVFTWVCTTAAAEMATLLKAEEAGSFKQQRLHMLARSRMHAGLLLALRGVSEACARGRGGGDGVPMLREVAAQVVEATRVLGEWMRETRGGRAAHVDADLLDRVQAEADCAQRALGPYPELARRGRTDLIAVLLQAGVDPHQRDLHGRLPFAHACDAHTADYLLPDVTLRFARCRPLPLGSGARVLATADAFRAALSKPDGRRRGECALFQALVRAPPDVARAVFEARGCGLGGEGTAAHARNKRGDTVLQVACRTHAAACRAWRARTDAREASKGEEALHKTMARRARIIVRWAASGAGGYVDPSAAAAAADAFVMEGLVEPDSFGRSALEYLAVAESVDALTVLLSHFRLVAHPRAAPGGCSKGAAAPTAAAAAQQSRTRAAMLAAMRVLVTAEPAGPCLAEAFSARVRMLCGLRHHLIGLPRARDGSDGECFAHARRGSQPSGFDVFVTTAADAPVTPVPLRRYVGAALPAEEGAALLAELDELATTAVKQNTYAAFLAVTNCADEAVRDRRFLACAVAHDSWAVLGTLLRRVMTKKERELPCNGSESLLHAVAVRGATGCARELVQACDVKQRAVIGTLRDKEGLTPLEVACELGHVGVVRAWVVEGVAVFPRCVAAALRPTRDGEAAAELLLALRGVGGSKMRVCAHLNMADVLEKILQHPSAEELLVAMGSPA